THEYLQVEINRFKPDIIFVLDHFRWEYPDVHSNVIFITWIQDVLPHLYDKRSVPKLQDLDFLLSIYIGYKEFDDVGYPYDKITYSPITVNDNIFKKYDISGSQKSHFGSDICYIANGGNPYEALDELKKIIIDDFSGLELIEDKLNEIFQILYDSCLNGDYTFTYERYKNIFTNVFGRYAMDIFPQYLLNSLLWFLRFKIEYSMHISSPLEWLHNEGYNIKLWGNSWNSHPVLNQHDMGVARHGEELSMIYNASKITLGLSPYISAHFRYFEATCSGCLYIGRDIPVEYDYSKMRMFFKEDKEILFFKKRDDLLKKVDYYLESHEKRKEIYDASIDKILNNFTYKSLMVNLLNEVSSRINNKVVI
ncbi:MAG TPA: glycosyltransferase, partial [Clostridia bacterium]